MRNILLILFVLLISGCSATGTSFNTLTSRPIDGHGIIYVYRPSSFVNGGTAPYVYINNQKKQKFKNSGFQMYELPPDKYVVATEGNFMTWSPGRSEITLELHVDETLYIRLCSSVEAVFFTSGTVVTDASLIQVTKELAKQELMNTNLSQ